MLHSLIAWTIHWAHTPYAWPALFLLAFAESSFFPIPPDVLLIALVLVDPSLAEYYATVCMLGSVLGGMFGYLIGVKGGRPLLERFVAQRKILVTRLYFERYGAWAVGIAAFTPIPYKVFTIAAGVFAANFPRFVWASVLGRGGRFFLVALTLKVFGVYAKPLIERYLNAATVIFVLLLIAGFIVMRKMPWGKLSKLKQ
ncbi:MAG: DedA family protein [Candidatus Tectomicrobia bacterium]|nr:DedA family protein [Candidatus Tectomicrobia bacterium]